MNYPSNMLWAAVLEAVDQLYDDKALSQKALRMKETIRNFSWNGDFLKKTAYVTRKES